MSKKLYWENPYLTECETRIAAIRTEESSIYLALEDDLFHPAGGGQPADHGSVEIDGQVFPVERLSRDGGRTWMQIGRTGVVDAAVGSTALCRIDWPRRLRLMRLHTASHVAMAALKTLIGPSFESHGMDIDETATEVELRFMGEGDPTPILEPARKYVCAAIESNRPVSVRIHKTIDEARRAYGNLFRVDPTLQLGGKVPLLVEAREIIAAFQAMIRKKTLADLDPWVERARTSLVASFANGVVKDKKAVSAAITSPWSNGQTEGQITKLKLVKRQMYGRGKLDLLQARVIGAG
jgi:Ser-tRNA(Ala) deacylase AlaX